MGADADAWLVLENTATEEGPPGLWACGTSLMFTYSKECMQGASPTPSFFALLALRRLWTVVMAGVRQEISMGLESLCSVPGSGSVIHVLHHCAQRAQGLWGQTTAALTEMSTWERQMV